MNYWKRILFIALLTAGGFLALHWLTPREQVLFSRIENHNMVLYSLDDTLTATVLCSAPTTFAYADGTACYVDYDGDIRTNWSLEVVDLASGLTRSIGEGTQADHLVDNRIVLSGDYVYLPINVVENNRITDTYIMEFDLDGTGGRTFHDLNYSLFSLLHAVDGTLYYIDEDTMNPVAFHMDTGQKQILSDKQILTYGAWTYIDDGRFWYGTAEGDATAYWMGTSTEPEFFVSGISLEDGTVTTIPLKTHLADECDYWIHDGYLYTMQNRRRISDETLQTYADLYQMDVDTQIERCICQEIPYDNNFPPSFTFGTRGIVVTDTILTQEGYKDTVYYIPYDGSGARPVHMP